MWIVYIYIMYVIVVCLCVLWRLIGHWIKIAADQIVALWFVMSLFSIYPDSLA